VTTVAHSRLAGRLWSVGWRRGSDNCDYSAHGFQNRGTLIGSRANAANDSVSIQRSERASLELFDDAQDASVSNLAPVLCSNKTV
jgi:hypothetical protein